MATAGGVRIEGLNAIVKKKKKAGVSLEDIKAAFKKVAEKAANEARSFVPTRTGRLRSTIKPQVRKNYAGVKAGGARSKQAGVINYGWEKRHIKPSRYLQKADDAVRDFAPKEIEHEIQKLLNDRGL